MKDRRRAILDDVAAGRMNPEAAAELLEELEGPEKGAVEGGLAAAPAIARLRVEAAFASVEVVGDPSVREAVVQGPHAVHREADALVVHSETWPGYGFHFGQARTSGDDHRRRVSIRMNPALALETEIQAGSLRVLEVRGPIKVEVQAGSVTIDGFEAPLDVSVEAGSLRARGRLQDGASRILCQAGNVRLRLAKDSDVRISARSEMGRVTLIEGGGWVLGADSHEAVIGGGRGTLVIETHMGVVNVGTD